MMVVVLRFGGTAAFVGVEKMRVIRIDSVASIR